MSTTQTTGTQSSNSGASKAAAATGRFLDDRFGLAKLGRASLRKVFPDHWSFMLGEIALYSFIILLLTGVFLTLWFQPSMAEVVYNGSYAPLKGVTMSQAYESALHISFDVRGGLVIRQIHHWAALLFMAAMIVHMFRIFFTGALGTPSSRPMDRGMFRRTKNTAARSPSPSSRTCWTVWTNSASVLAATRTRLAMVAALLMDAPCRPRRRRSRSTRPRS